MILVAARISSLSLFVILSLNILGCAGFSRGNSKEIEEAKGFVNPDTQSTQRLVYWTTRWTVLDDGVLIPEEQFSNYNLPSTAPEIISRTVRDSNMFELVNDRAAADYFIDMNAKVENEITFGNVYLSALTAFILPQWGNSGHQLKLILSDKKGVTIGEVTGSGHVFFMTQILLLPLTPFVAPNPKEKSIFESTLREMLKQVYDHKWLDRKSSKS